MLDRSTHRDRHLLAAGVTPRARREQCANTPWGDVRPAASGFGAKPGATSLTGGRTIEAGKDQRGRTGMGGAVT